jgi:hypothetical protein
MLTFVGFSFFASVLVLVPLGFHLTNLQRRTAFGEPHVGEPVARRSTAWQISCTTTLGKPGGVMTPVQTCTISFSFSAFTFVANLQDP